VLPDRICEALALTSNEVAVRLRNEPSIACPGKVSDRRFSFVFNYQVTLRSLSALEGRLAIFELRFLLLTLDFYYKVERYASAAINNILTIINPSSSKRSA
jgi:hypothetical protein